MMFFQVRQIDPQQPQPKQGPLWALQSLTQGPRPPRPSTLGLDLLVGSRQNPDLPPLLAQPLHISICLLLSIVSSFVNSPPFLVHQLNFWLWGPVWLRFYPQPLLSCCDCLRSIWKKHHHNVSCAYRIFRRFRFWYVTRPAHTRKRKLSRYFLLLYLHRCNGWFRQRNQT